MVVMEGEGVGHGGEGGGRWVLLLLIPVQRNHGKTVLETQVGRLRMCEI